MIDKKTRTRVSNLMRRDLKKTHYYNEAKNRHFKGKTVYQCPSCSTLFYTGASQKNFDKLKEEEYPDLVRCKSKDLQMDHIDPVVPYDTDLHSMSLDEIAYNVYCLEKLADNLQYICTPCHKEKSKVEASIRAKYRELEKLDK